MASSITHMSCRIFTVDTPFKLFGIFINFSFPFDIYSGTFVRPDIQILLSFVKWFINKLHVLIYCLSTFCQQPQDSNSMFGFSSTIWY